MRVRPLTFILSLLVSSYCAHADESPKKAHDEKEAIRKGLAYVESKSLTWMRQRNCASCHHVPMMVWAQRDARQRGFQIDENGLREATDFLLQNPRARIEQTPESDGIRFSPADAYTLLAFRDGGTVAEPAAQDTLKKVAAHLLSTQQADGSWEAFEGHPPIYGASPEVTTLFAAFVLDATRTPDSTGDQVKMREWLAAHSKGEDHEALCWRVLIGHERKSSVEHLLKRQNADGGWSQTKERASDAYATGQAVYALVSRGGVDSSAQAVVKARDFLLKTQDPDGSWPMTSRPHLLTGETAKNREPITVAASAWAVLGLLQGSSPAPR